MTRYSLLLLLGVLFHLGSFLLMVLGIEPFYSFFYILAWWTYLLVLSCLNHQLKRNSLLFDRTVEFLWMFCFSVLAWLFFEACNFRLQNWFYIGVPVEPILRWPGYLIAYGTVLPGIFETEILLKNLRVFDELQSRGIRVNKSLRVRLVLVGALMIVAPMISPQLFFPLIWLGLVFLLDPLLYAAGPASQSFLRQAEEGQYGHLLRLMLGGLICGLLWEFWNFWAGSKWIYTLPAFDFLRIFEMPLLGYMGFPFFALECYLLYQVFLIVKANLQKRKILLLAVILIAACYSAVIIAGIDQWTVVTYKVLLTQTVNLAVPHALFLP